MAFAATTLGCAAVWFVFYRSISPATARLWTGAFVSHRSIGSFASSLGWVVWHLLADAVGLGTLSAPARIALVVLWLTVAAVGLAKNRSMLAPALAVVVAVLAAAAHTEPLGTGRSDQYLYPALLLLTAAGATRIAAVIVRDVGRRPRRQVQAIVVTGVLVECTGPRPFGRPRLVDATGLPRCRRRRAR